MIPPEWLNNLAAPYTRRHGGVAVVGALGETTATHFRGETLGGEPPPGERTLFELGGVTQVFTALLLAVAVRDERLALDQPVAELGPELAGLPEWITPLRLATHTAGIPRLPPATAGRSMLNTENPYAAFGLDDLLAWAESYRPRRAPSETAFAHSILGMGLLGVALAMAYDTPFDEALAERVLAPLRMGDTVFVPTEEQAGRMATPHDRRGQPVPAWNYAGLAGAGGLKSTAADMGTFLTALLGAKDDAGPLAGPIRETLEIRRKAPRPDGEGGGLGWAIVLAGKPPAFICTASGQTNGSQALLAVAPGPGLGATILANTGPRGRDTLRPPRREALRSFTMAWSLPGSGEEADAAGDAAD